MNESILPNSHEYKWLSNKDFKTYRELNNLGALSLELNFPQVIYFFKGNYSNPYRLTFQKNSRSINLKIENEHLYTINKCYKLNCFDEFDEFAEFDLINIDGLGSVLLKFYLTYKNKFRVIIKAQRDINILRNDVVKNHNQVLVLETNFKNYRNV
tara:strand:- start:1187 stop:1651 length:465 start_codon:yes stop_codon:yes gene_type:complete